MKSIKISIFKVMVTGLVISLFSSGMGVVNQAWADTDVKLYYAQNAQIELVSPDGVRVFIDVHDPDALTAPPTPKDVLLTTHNHADHRRLDFIRSFPGKQLDTQTGDIKLNKIAIQGIASVHNEGDAFRDKDGTNYIYIIDMAGLRIAHFGDIGQSVLNAMQVEALGKVDIAIMQLANSFSDMTAENKKAFNLMDQVAPHLIIPTHVFDSTCAKIAADKWIAFNSYKKGLVLSPDGLPEKTTIIFMGNNSNLIKLPYITIF